MIDVHPIRNRADLKTFIKFPWEVYRNDPQWVPHLIIDRLEYFNRKKNPFFHHSDAQLFLARRNGDVVGRIAAVRYERHLEVYDDDTGFFGFFESINDQTVVDSLFDSAADWLKSQGLRRMRGPMNFTINDECGLLVDGFDTPHVIMLTHNPPYYPQLIEQYGFEKTQDLYAYRIDRPKRTPKRLKRAMKMIEERHGITVRPVDMKSFDADVEGFHSIHSQAWSENWGAVPLTVEEFRRIAKELKLILDPELIFIVEANGKPIGISVTIPNVNEALKHANGRLFPLGLLKILWHKRKVESVRVLIMGVLKEHRVRGLDAAMYYKTMEAALDKGYQWGDMSWVLESNVPMRRVLERVGARIYRTYRIYDLNLS